LRGHVLPIGGSRRSPGGPPRRDPRVLIPIENEKDIRENPGGDPESIQIELVEHMTRSCGALVSRTRKTRASGSRRRRSRRGRLPASPRIRRL